LMTSNSVKWPDLYLRDEILEARNSVAENRNVIRSVCTAMTPLSKTLLMVFVTQTSMQAFHRQIVLNPGTSLFAKGALFWKHEIHDNLCRIACVLYEHKSLEHRLR
jgi:hypothetical protein